MRHVEIQGEEEVHPNIKRQRSLREPTKLSDSDEKVVDDAERVKRRYWRYCTYRLVRLDATSEVKLTEVQSNSSSGVVYP